ncbi:quinon protein alcohol dehydrogenase-like superfamily [Boletus reticuloceps]|uniref:Quinon protein alcohol dehydrogenase-like superfamily n=1 Tax=Boletus reticuloceps TaxID=495285 RepID=A0A8I3AE76_9AGAM|nr:quinon protein alcohol dehydrogenase-like superfamily [Boletus reticuloceps]
MEHDSGSIINLAVTRDGTKVISSDEEGRIKLWDVESHKLVREWTCSAGYPKITISPDDRFVAVGSWGMVEIYSMKGGQVNRSIDVGDDDDEFASVWCISFSPNGDKLACGSIGSNIRVYDVKTGALILGPLDHNYNITCLLWSRDGDRLFSASYETIRCWNAKTGEQIGHRWTGQTDWIFSLSLSPDGSILASASKDKYVRFWDATTGDHIGQHLQHDGSVRVVSFSPSGEFVASIDEKKIYLWRVPWRSSVTLEIDCILSGLTPSYATTSTTSSCCTLNTVSFLFDLLAKSGTTVSAVRPPHRISSSGGSNPPYHQNKQSVFGSRKFW